MIGRGLPAPDVREIHDWLADLHETDPAAALLVGQALAALMSEGASLGSPWSPTSKPSAAA